MTFKASVFHFQDEIPELEEFFLVNVTSAVLITTFATVPQLGKKSNFIRSERSSEEETEPKP